MSRGALLFLFAYALGFVAAIPVGGSQIELAKRAIGGQLAGAGLVAGSLQAIVHITTPADAAQPILESVGDMLRLDS